MSSTVLARHSTDMPTSTFSMSAVTHCDCDGATTGVASVAVVAATGAVVLGVAAVAVVMVAATGPAVAGAAVRGIVVATVAGGVIGEAVAKDTGADVATVEQQ